MFLHKSTWFTSLLAAACMAVLAPILVYHLWLDAASAQEVEQAAPASTATSTRGAGQSDATATGQITYHFAWEWGAATPDADGRGWTVTTALGYQVHITEGYAVVGGAQLVSCAHEHTTQQSVLAPLVAPFAPQVAQAGHGGDHDRSQIGQPLVESLTEPVTTTVNAHFGDEPSYCQLHYLTAYAPESAANQPTDIEMVGRALYLSGAYLAPNTHTPTPFTISSNLAWGSMIELALHTDSPSAIELANMVDAQITLHRTLGSLLDDVDFVNMTESEAARAILRTLTSSATVEVRLGS
ncbi:MAG: hypothetical protein R2911_00585 [Caldilineaceae bacterium]